MKIERGTPRLVKPHDCNVAGDVGAVPRWVGLSSSDLVVPVVHVEVVYAFQGSGDGGGDAAVVVLEEALGKVLVEYREWAGRLGRDVETGRPAIELSDEGVVFVEAVADGMLREVFPFDPSPLLLDMVPPNRGVPELLLVQVTKFKCGGLSLGVARHHQVADGEAASQFMEAWASACKGLPIRPILHDRGALMPNYPPMPTFPHDEYKKPPPKPNSEALATTLPTLVRKKLHFNPETLQRIKSSAVKENDERGFPTYTTFESLTGHLWRCITKARGLTGDTATRNLVAVNGRRRLSPSLPKNFFGNVIFHANPTTSVRRLLEEPLSYAAGIVHASIGRIDNNYMRSAIDYVEQERMNPAPDVARSRSTVLSPNLSVTSWVQLPLYSLDFGWGTPVFAGPPFVPFEGLVILTPSYTQDGSIDVLVGLFADYMAKLESICFDVPSNDVNTNGSVLHEKQ
ncbi:hypothetical protein M758_10G167200 [Ceratodon purpureus]|nr:hypothetical protein M758_10G167200 [Ceratodon purpureus]